MKLPLVSIIIPTYNEQQGIGGCLKSLTDQTYQNCEIIVVDDGSTDQTIYVVRSLQNRSKQINLTQTSHRGAGAARNFGANFAKGEILVFVDADMTVDKEFVRQLIDPILHQTSKGTFTKHEYVANFENPWARCWNFEYTRERTRCRLPSNHPDTSPVFRAIVKSEFDRVGGYDEIGYGEDWSLSHKLGYQATLAPGARMHHTNPASPGQVWRQAHWLATRPYKKGEWGRGVGLLRASLPISLAMALVGVVRYREPFFLIFKLWYDFALSVGIIKFWLTGRYAQ